MPELAAYHALAHDVADFQSPTLPVNALQSRKRIGVLRAHDEVPVDRVLERVARTVQKDGVAVVGYLQREIPVADNCCSEMYLEDINSAVQHRISQSLGPGSTGCRLDPQGLTAAAGSIRAEVERGADLLILNRFGKGEAGGGGFRAVIEAAILQDIPVLLAARDSYREDWRLFAEGLFEELPLDVHVVVNWSLEVSKGSGSSPLSRAQHEDAN